MMVLLIDNYDSFVYNIYQYIGMCGYECKVVRNDNFEIEEIIELSPDMIIISPGPGTPDDAGKCIPLVREFHNKIPILGICLGHQVIGKAFGAKVSYADELMHGKFSMIHHGGDNIFKGMPEPFEGARYHSLAVFEEGLPIQLEVTARTEKDEIMAMRHSEFPVFGLQFHPESILTRNGMQIVKNFLEGRYD